MKLARLSGLGRPIVWSCPSNRAIVLIAGGFAAARLLARRDVGWPTAGVFGAWSLLRELAPEQHVLAPVAAVVVAPSFWQAPPAAARDRAVTTGLTMLAARIATRSSGRAPTALDYVALAALSLGLPRSRKSWLAAALVAGAVVYDRLRRR